MRLCVVWIAVAVIFTAPSAAAQSRPSYQSLLQTYLAGDTASALSEIVRWNEGELRRNVEAFPMAKGANPWLVDAPTMRTGESTALLGAAVLLHTEAALRGDESVRSAHIGLAIAALAAFNRKEVKPEFGKSASFVLLNVLSYLRRREIGQVFEEVSTRFGTDARLSLASAAWTECWALDSLAHATRHVAGEDWAAERDARYRLEEAEAEYKEAMKRQPTLLEAKLRHARVLTLLGKDEDVAAHELEQVIRESTEVFLSYLANIFFADLSERARRLDTAVEHYRAATRVCPDGQVAYFGLARLLEEAGRSDEARQAIATVMQKTTAGSAQDPWWVYYAGQFWQTDRELRRLREMLRQ